MGVPTGDNSLLICSIRYHNVSDGQTDGRTDRQSDRQYSHINVARQYADTRQKLKKTVQQRFETNVNAVFASNAMLPADAKCLVHIHSGVLRVSFYVGLKP